MRDELSVQDGIIFRGERLVVPQALRSDMKRRLHSSHLGIDGCLRRARECIFWPGMSAEIKECISMCEICHKYDTSPQKETLMSHDVPTRPWEKVGVDLFEIENRDYLVTVDYYSNYWEIDRLYTTTAKTVVQKLKSHFARYGIPNQVVSDNGPQFSCEEFASFAKCWDFEHVPSSPGNSKANGKAESAVKSAKRLLKKTADGGEDQYLALLDSRNTPNQGMDSSPVQRLMNRRTKTLLPTASRLLLPRSSNTELDRDKLKLKQQKQAQRYNKSAKDLPVLMEGDVVRMQPFILGQKEWRKAVVTSRLDERSYNVQTPNGTYRRNRAHIRKTPEVPPDVLPCHISPSGTPEVQPRPNMPQSTVTGTPQHTMQTSPRGNAPQQVANTERRSGRTTSRPGWMKDFVPK